MLVNLSKRKIKVLASMFVYVWRNVKFSWFDIKEKRKPVKTILTLHHTFGIVIFVSFKISIEINKRIGFKIVFLNQKYLLIQVWQSNDYCKMIELDDFLKKKKIIKIMDKRKL